MTAPYRKPHLTIADQVALLRRRGLVVADDVAAAQLLGAVGYYRLSAYVYPYRELLPPITQPESRTQFRADTIRAGTTFEQVAALHEFDLRLRRLCLAATGTVEVGLRTRWLTSWVSAIRSGRRTPMRWIGQRAEKPSVTGEPASTRG